MQEVPLYIVCYLHSYWLDAFQRRVNIAKHRHNYVPIVLLGIQYCHANRRSDCCMKMRMRMVRNHWLCLQLVVCVLCVFIVYHYTSKPRGVSRSDSGYILTLDYLGQQMAGCRAIISQQHWLSYLYIQASIVEPFTTKSRLKSNSSIWSSLEAGHGETPLRLQDLYDVDHFNKLSTSVDQAILVEWEDFLKNAPRQIIAVTVSNPQQIGCLDHTRKEDYSLGKSIAQHQTLRSFQEGCVTEDELTSAVLYLKKHHNFEIVRSVCLNCEEGMSKEISPVYIYNMIYGSWDPRKVTVVFNKWRMSFSAEVISANKFMKKLISSPRIISDANRYISSVLKTRHYAAVMVRLEWIVIAEKQGTLKKLEECFGEAELYIKQKEEQLNLILPRFVTVDVGKYGSGENSFQHSAKANGITKEMLNKVNETMLKVHIPQIAGGSWSLAEWENTFSAFLDRGYIAALQSTIAAKADVLVQMGSGHYLLHTQQEYQKWHKDPSKQHNSNICCPKYMMN